MEWRVISLQQMVYEDRSFQLFTSLLKITLILFVGLLTLPVVF
jgi:hypothetical protein